MWFGILWLTLVVCVSNFDKLSLVHGAVSFAVYCCCPVCN